MNITRELAGAALGVAVAWTVRTRIAKKDVKNLAHEFDSKSTETFTYAFSAGWDSAREQYVRYYTREQYQLYFGVDRGY